MPTAKTLATYQEPVLEAGNGRRHGVAYPPPPLWDECAEQAVLGAMLLDQVAAQKAIELLDDSMFYKEAHRILFRAMVSLTGLNDVIDPVTLREELSRRDDLDRAGGMEYLATLLDVVPTAANVQNHARIVRDYAQRRDLVVAGTDIVEATTNPTFSRERLAGAITRAATLCQALSTTGVARFRLFTAEELHAVPTRVWLLDYLIPAAGLAGIYGAPGSIKTFVAIAMAGAVATGTPWLRWAARPGLVVFAASEGGWGLDARLRAWQKAQGIADLKGLRVLPEPVNLLMESEVTGLLSSVAATCPEPPALFVFDTLAGSMAGGDENTAKDMSLVIAQSRRIARNTGAAVLLIHHSGRDETRERSERGSTALRGGVDVMFKLTRVDGIFTFTNDKQRDAPLLEPLRFRLKPIDDSCVVECVESSPASQPTLTRGDFKVLKALHESFEGRETSTGQWLLVSPVSRATFHRSLKKLVGLGCVTYRDKLYGVSPAGETVLRESLKVVSSTSRETHPDSLTHLGGPIEGPRVRPGVQGELER